MDALMKLQVVTLCIYADTVSLAWMLALATPVVKTGNAAIKIVLVLAK